MKNSCGPNSESLTKLVIDQFAIEGMPVTVGSGSCTKDDQSRKDFLKEVGLKDGSCNSEEEVQSAGKQAGQENANRNSEEECHGEDIYTGISP